jgi:hypothetical protein
MVRSLARLAAFAVLVGLTACGGSESTAPAQSINGTWSLQTVNGAPLPYVLSQSGADKIEVLSDVFTLGAASAFTRTTTVRTTTGGQATTSTIPDSGTFAVSGSTVTIHLGSDASASAGAWSGNTITIAESGLTFVYMRQ